MQRLFGNKHSSLQLSSFPAEFEVQTFHHRYIPRDSQLYNGDFCIATRNPHEISTARHFQPAAESHPQRKPLLSGIDDINRWGASAMISESRCQHFFREPLIMPHKVKKIILRGLNFPATGFPHNQFKKSTDCRRGEAVKRSLFHSLSLACCGSFQAFSKAGMIRLSVLAGWSGFISTITTRVSVVPMFSPK